MESVLVKKLSERKVSRSPIADTERLADRFVLLMEHQLGPMLNTSVGGMVLETRMTRMSSFSEGVAVPALLGAFSLKGTENRALINASTDLMFHIIDMRMGGDPEQCPTPATRSFTALDYALCKPILIGIAMAFEQALAEALGGPLQHSLELADIQQNITHLIVAPDTADVLHLNASLDIGDAGRTGELDFVIPLSVLDIARASVRKQAEDPLAISNDIWRSSMRRAVAATDITLDAVLHRQEVKASVLEDLEVGQILTIPLSAPQGVEIRMATDGGEPARFATARLGEFEGRKVVKLNTDPNPEIVSYLKRATD